MHSEPIDGPIQPAASVVMLRDSAGCLEVFLLKRHGLSDVLGGAYVFPGGKVDPADANPQLQAYLDTPAVSLHAALAETHLAELDAAALYVAALREALEETGVLYATAGNAAEAALAQRLLREGRPFNELSAQLALRLEVSRLQPWSRWITPRLGAVVRKRFDTRFFLAAVPAGQIARHDDYETTASAWFTPRAALRQYQEGVIELAPPQIMSLAHLARHDCVASVMNEASQRKPPLILPEPFEHEGERVICYPGDEQHPVRERALPGPTRLYYRNRRFEPAGGLESLLPDLA